jgi:hypothetical protein
MLEYAGERRPVVDAFARLIADITQAPSDADSQRLRWLTAAALRTELESNLTQRVSPPAATPVRQIESGAAQVELLQQLDEMQAAGAAPSEPIVVVRRDEREALLQGEFLDSLSGLAPVERLGPFGTLGGTNIWFDVFRPSSRLEIWEAGASQPALVLTLAHPAIVRRPNTTIDILAGTVWIRGDLVMDGLPSGAYIGIKVSGGSVSFNIRGTLAGEVLTLPAPLRGTLRLNLAPDAVAPVPGACSSAGVTVTLSDTLTFAIGGGRWTVEGTPASATVWGQTFQLGASTGNWTFIDRLWTAVLEYDVTPQQFDAAPIANDLATFGGVGTILVGGIGFPVVATPFPAILGEAAHAGNCYLEVDQLTARWYAPDTRTHVLQNVWIEVAETGATLIAEHVAALSPPVAQTYELWTLTGNSHKRLPWRETYAAAFDLLYRCNVVDGEWFTVFGTADVALDRPVTSDGVPIPTPTTASGVVLHSFGGSVTIWLGAAIQDDHLLHQFALRNALVWTGLPTFVFVQGQLTSGSHIDSGNAQLLLGVYAWAPTLPDPYVSSGWLRGPGDRPGEARSQLWARVDWPTPDNAVLSFAGQLGSQVALGGRNASASETVPGRMADDGAVRLTQVAQGSLRLDEKTAADWRTAQETEARARGRRIESAAAANKLSGALVDRSLLEVVGPQPNLILLDVSTNQDLLGVGVGLELFQGERGAAPAGTSGQFSVADLAVESEMTGMRVMTLPQAQWEPVRTLDIDQDIMTLGWFPTPLASATDGGPTLIGARSQRLMPIIPEDALDGTFAAFKEGTSVGIRTTFPFGLLGAVVLQPNSTPTRKPDLYDLTRPGFSNIQSTGGIQVTAQAEGGRPDDGGIYPMFQGVMRQLLNGVDLASGAPLGISVLGSTADPAGSVETVFNDDMAARPRVPVTRIDLSGYGGSNFSDWNNPFAAFAEAAKVQFNLMVGRTALEVIKVNSVLHPWGIRVTRSVTVERRPGGGVIRRDSGWQAFTPGIFDYRYFDSGLGAITVAPYVFDAGVFRGLFNVRNIRPAPGTPFGHGTATLVPYYFDADVALDGVPGRTAAIGVLGYLQTTPNGVPAGADALQALIETQGPIGGPIETPLNFGGSGLPFRAQRVEVGLAMDAGSPVFVATVRGVPKLPTTGAWSVVVRPVAGVAPNAGEAVTVEDNRGVPIVRRYPVAFPANDMVFTEPPLAGTPGDYRFADATDLLTPTAPANDYALLQSTPTHAFAFPRPWASSAPASRLESGYKPALVDTFARSTSKGAFPPPANSIELGPGAFHLDVGPGGTLALSSPIVINGYPTPLQLSGTTGHGSKLYYDTATIQLDLEANRWQAEFSGLRIWTDITGLQHVTGAEMRVVGSTEQRSQVAEVRTLLLQEIEDIMAFIPIFGNRGVQGPYDLGASNAKHEFKVYVEYKLTIPKTQAVFPAGAGVKLVLSVGESTGIDIATGGAKASAIFGAQLDGKFPVLSIGVGAVFIIVTGKITFSLASVSGSVKSEALELTAFAGVGVEGKIGGFQAYAFLGVGFVLAYDAVANQTKYGGLVALEAGVDLNIVQVKVRAELKGLVYKSGGSTKCDYTGSVKIEVDIFLVFSISASYVVSDTTTL